MSGLLFLADVAITDRRPQEEVKRTAEVGIQTESVQYCHMEELEPFRLHNDHSVHDYLKTADFDFLVNSTHDYYDRVAAPEYDCDHCYAFPLPATKSQSASTNLYASCQDNLIEEEVNTMDACVRNDEAPILDTLNSREVFEELIYPTSSGNDDEPLCAGCSPCSDSFNDILAVISKQASEENACLIDTIIEVGDVDFKNLMEYLMVGVSEFEPNQTDTAENRDISQEDKMSQQKTVCKWDRCPWSGSNSYALVAHINSSHLTASVVTSPWICQWAGCLRETPFKRRYLLERHMRRHTLERPFYCCVCKQSFITQDRLTIHERIHNGQRPYSCSICNRVFASSGERRRHLKTHY